MAEERPQPPAPCKKLATTDSYASEIRCDCGSNGLLRIEAFFEKHTLSRLTTMLRGNHAAAAVIERNAQNAHDRHLDETPASSVAAAAQRRVRAAQDLQTSSAELKAEAQHVF